MARRRKQLGSSAAIHTAEATKASREIDNHAATTVNQARNGKCQVALMAYADMQRAIGRYEAHVAAGGKAWKPQTAIREGAAAFNDRCVRESGQVSGSRRRRR